MPAKSATVLFRFRLFIVAAGVVLGFWSPWDRRLGWEGTRVWLEIPSEIARLGWMPLGRATLGLTIAAVACAVLAAVLRTWGTAYLHPQIVYDRRMHGEQVMADGPFRYVRNPLYVGSLFHVLALAILMSPSGAVFAIAFVQGFHAVLIAGEERWMLKKNGERYAEYVKRVPRWFPSLRARVAGASARPAWGQAVMGEIYFIAVAVLFVAVAWRYNAQLLERGVLIAYGARMILRAAMPARRA